jgi:hypothetical protein
MDKTKFEKISTELDDDCTTKLLKTGYLWRKLGVFLFFCIIFMLFFGNSYFNNP